MDFPRRMFDGEGVKGDVDFGPTLMLNRQRCILCTRCVRFMREIDSDAQIGIVDRGNGSEIATFREEGVNSLLSGNLMDVCPVGAITTKQYRFKSRPWDNPGVVDTVCTLCAKGCNTSAWLKAKPEWARGSRLDPDDASTESRRQQLLDVRHRPLRLPVGRERTAPAPPDDAPRHGSSKPAAWHDVDPPSSRSHSAGGFGGPDVRSVPRLRACLDRRAVRAAPGRRRAARRRGDEGRQHVVVAQRQTAAARRRSSRFRRPTPRTSTARRRSATTLAPATMACRTCRDCGRRSRAAA